MLHVEVTDRKLSFAHKIGLQVLFEHTTPFESTDSLSFAALNSVEQHKRIVSDKSHHLIKTSSQL